MNRSVWSSMCLALSVGCGVPIYMTDTSAEVSAVTAISHDGSGTTADTGSSSADISGTVVDTAVEGQPETSADTAADASAGDAATCGDGDLNSGEECDNGFGSNGDGAMCLLDCVLARCGDGFVFTGKEECDDENGDPADGCHLCFRSRKVFVTSETYKADEFMGIVGVDERCKSQAAIAGLPNFLNYKAWISDSTTSPAERMYRGRGRYELVNGLLVADSWEDLLVNGPKIPIVVDENSETHETGVWTGTRPDGTAADGSNHCADWSSINSGDKGFWGVTTEITNDWTLADAPSNPSDCGAPRALLCFEQE